MNKDSSIYVAGHRGLVGSAIVRCLRARGYVNILMKSSSELDLMNQQAVENFFRVEKPEYVFLAAAK
ncbi:MAG: NAD-dependent epimerase/dehydratase family protein, partial [Holosporaceae bacterium]|nr:NAD-dependent epimerase/dehydratase family protein [Holosporaceae bacterium]